MTTLFTHDFTNSDAAENSIMQTITIAVSAILIAAGLVTAPGLINNARDNNATGDLANIAYAEASVESLSEYMSYDNHPDSQYRLLENPADDGSVKFTPSGYNATKDGAGRLLSVVDGKQWVAFSKSSSGKVFMRTSENATTSLVTDELREQNGFAPLFGTAATFAGQKLTSAFSAQVVGAMYQAVLDDAAYDFTRGGTVAAPTAGIGGVPVANPGDGTTPGDGGSTPPVSSACASSTVANPYTVTYSTASAKTTVCDATGVLYSYATEYPGGQSQAVVLENTTGLEEEFLFGMAVEGKVTTTFEKTVTYLGGTYSSLRYAGAQLYDMSSGAILPSTCTSGNGTLTVGQSITIKCSADIDLPAGGMASVNWQSVEFPDANTSPVLEGAANFTVFKW